MQNSNPFGLEFLRHRSRPAVACQLNCGGCNGREGRTRCRMVSGSLGLAVLGSMGSWFCVACN